MSSSANPTTRHRFLFQLACTLSLAASISQAGQPTPGMLRLDDIPGGSVYAKARAVSGDGEFASGASINSSAQVAARWNSSGAVTPITSGSLQMEGFGISLDGTYVVGTRLESLSSRQAWRWTSSSGFNYLGDLPGGDFWSEARDVSDDGSVVVGIGETATDQQAFRWKSGQGMMSLGTIGGSSGASRAFGVSGDGTRVVGNSDSNIGNQAYIWKEGQGMAGLGGFFDPLDPNAPMGVIFFSTASAISADGSTVVGTGSSAQSGNNGQAFIWTEGAGLVGLGDLPGGQFRSEAVGVSGDGTYVVGRSWTASGQELFLWSQALGMRNLRTYLEDVVELDLTGWALLDVGGISDDGNVIVGFGSFNGQSSAWMAVLPEPATLLLVCMCIGLRHRRRI